MACGESARAELPRLTPFPSTSSSFPFLFPPLPLFTLFLSLSFSPLLFFLPVLHLLPFFLLFPVLFFFHFPLPFLLSTPLLPSPPALLLPQKAENAEGQAPAIGPDGEVSPGSSYKSWDGQEGAIGILPLQATVNGECRPCPTGSIRSLPPPFSQRVQGSLGLRIPNPCPSASPTAAGRDKPDE